MPPRLKAKLDELRQNWRALAVSLAFGLAGAFLFVELTMPLPWVLGPLFTTVSLAMAGFRVWIPAWLVFPMYAVLGVLFGTTVSEDLGAQLAGWIPSILAVLGYVIVTVTLITAYFRKLAGFDFVTAYFSAAPGGLITMTALGHTYGGDQRAIALTQSIRLIGTVLIVPVAFRLFAGYQPSGALGTGGDFAHLGPRDAAIMLGAAVAGYYAGRLLRLPVPQLLGPMFLLAALKFAGISTAGLPGPLVAVAQLAIGVSIGTTFGDVKIRTFGRVLFHGATAAVLMIAVAALLAVAIHPLTGAPTQALILAFAPGGFAELAIVAYTLGIDVTFVVGHQIIRYLFITFVAPLAFAVLHKRRTTP